MHPYNNEQHNFPAKLYIYIFVLIIFELQRNVHNKKRQTIIILKKIIFK